MEPFELLRYVAGIIEKMGMRYFVTGSTVTIFYGEPRLTIDIDIVVDLAERQVAEFCRQFPPEKFYVSEDAARAAVLHKGQFNIIHPDSGLKIDVIVPAPTAFNESRFARVRRLHTADDFDANFTSPEDAILKKMDFYRQGESEKHLRDIAGILKTSEKVIDIAYIERWAQEMGLEEVWSLIQKRAKQNE